jgi:HAD superfamily hydrolase (TIGR01509 family)
MSSPAVLLDLDRTLVDVETHVDYAAAVRDLAAADLLAPAAGTTRDTSWGTATVQAMDALVALADDDRWARASELVARHEVVAVDRARPMPGLRPFLEAVAGAPTAVVTLLSDAATTRVLAAHDIRVDVVVARRPGLRPKPAPDQVVAALEGLGVAATEAIMLGDSERDEAAARGAGVRFIGLTNGRRESRFTSDSVVADLRGAIALLAS